MHDSDQFTGGGGIPSSIQPPESWPHDMMCFAISCMELFREEFQVEILAHRLPASLTDSSLWDATMIL